jgi:hypothetical protein
MFCMCKGSTTTILSFLSSLWNFDICRCEGACRNPSLGLVTKARACKGVGQEGSPGVTSHVPRNARECEGMTPHTPKGAPTLGVGVPMDSRIFMEQLQGPKLNGLKISFNH